VQDFGEESVVEKVQGPPFTSVKTLLGSVCQLVEKFTSNTGKVVVVTTGDVVVVEVVVAVGIVVVVVGTNNCVCQLEFWYVTPLSTASVRVMLCLMSPKVSLH
jgi:hypothetical protein